MENKSRLDLWLLCLVFFNIIDAMMTSAWLETGMAREANPLMRYCWELSPFVFLFVKLFVFNVCCLFIYAHKEVRRAAKAIKFLTVVYGLLALYHLGFLFYILVV